MSDLPSAAPRNRRSARHNTTLIGAKAPAPKPAQPARESAAPAPVRPARESAAPARSAPGTAPLARLFARPAPGAFPLRAVIVLALCAVIAALLLVSANGKLRGLRTQRERDKAAYETLVARHTVGYRDLIEKYSAQYSLKPAFVAAVILRESSYDPAAQSGAGARGLMQVMEDTFTFVRKKLGEDTTFNDMFDPEINIRYGCWYLSYLSRFFNGDPVEIACAYHAGPNNVKLWIMNYAADGEQLQVSEIPMEDTRSYAGKVLAAYAIYQQHYYGET